MQNELTLIQQNPDRAVDLTGGRFHGWLFFRHPDGQFVSERKLEEWEIIQVEDQIDQGIIIDGRSSSINSKSGVRFA